MLYRLVFLILSLKLSLIFATDAKDGFWYTQRRGANFFNEFPSEDWFKAAKEVGIQFARLAPDKWHGEKRDFLLGDADAFEDVSLPDFLMLQKVLDQAEQHDVKIVLTMLSLPGSR